ncbi:hypothetical protein KKH43_06305 [Patescibacteria group bacterium]|nr:hypothetical protein [Patescibacteria group bacterium]
MKSFFRKKAIESIQALSKKFLVKYSPKIVAITGSVGKTSTREACFAVLSKKYRCIKNYDSALDDRESIPIAILGEGRDPHGWFDMVRMLLRGYSNYFFQSTFAEFVILEIRVKNPGDIKKVYEYLGTVDVGVLTAISDIPSHVENFKDIEAFTREKMSIISLLSPRALALVNMDDDRVVKALRKVTRNVIRIGFDNDADYFAESPNICSDDIFYRGKSNPCGITYKLHYEQNSIPIRLPHIFSVHQIYPSLFSIVIGLTFEMNLVEIAAALTHFKPPHHRMEALKGIKNSIIIDDTFNASPASCDAALGTTRLLDAKGKKIAVLGDMLELGVHTEKGHREVGKKVCDSVDCLLTYGDRAAFITDEAQKTCPEKKCFAHFTDKQELIQALSEHYMAEGDLLLIKGSRLMHMEEIVRALIVPQST